MLGMLGMGTWHLLQASPPTRPPPPRPWSQRNSGRAVLLRLVAGMNRLQLRPFDRWARQMPQDGATALEPIALQHVRAPGRFFDFELATSEFSSHHVIA